MSRRYVFKIEGFIEDPVAKKSAFWGLSSLLVVVFDEGWEGANEGRIEIVLVWEDSPAEEIELEIVHLSLVEEAEQFGGLILFPIGQN